VGPHRSKEGAVPLFMDTHRFEGEMPSDDQIAQAHAADLAEQDRHGVRYLKYWD
jgi:hypothetical protein